MNKNIVVAVDGPAGSGKSSVSRQVAIKAGLKYIDSGAIYRSITWYVLKKYGNIPGDSLYEKDLEGLDIVQDFKPDGETSTFVNKQDVSLLIRDEIIAKNIGIISDNRAVRDFVTTLLRKWANEVSIIMDVNMQVVGRIVRVLTR